MNQLINSTSNVSTIINKYQAPVWGEALIPVTRMVIGDGYCTIVGDVEPEAEAFVTLLGDTTAKFSAKSIFNYCNKLGVDAYIHDGELNIVWRPGKFGTPMIGDMIHLTENNPLKWGKYIGRLFNNVDHVVEGVSVSYMALDLALNDGGGIVSRSFLSRVYGEEYPEAIYYTYLGDSGLTKGLAVVGETFGADLILPKDIKGVVVQGMDGTIAVSAGHCHTRVEVDNQTLQNIDAIRPHLTGWLMDQVESMKKDASKHIPAWMDGANVPSMVRKYARSLVTSVLEDATLRIQAPLLRGYYRPSFDLQGDEIQITISERTYKGHPALILIEYSADVAGANLARMGGGDYDDSSIAFIDTAKQVVLWRQPNAPYEHVLGTIINHVPSQYVHEHVWVEGVQDSMVVIPTVVDAPPPSSLVDAYGIASESKGAIGIVVNTIALLKDIMGRYPHTIPSLEGIIGVQNKGKGIFTYELKQWMKATGDFIESHSEFISEFYWGKYVSKNKGEWVKSARGIFPAFEDSLLGLARVLASEFMAWVDKNVVPYALPPRKWVETAPYIDDKGILGVVYGRHLTNVEGKDAIQRAINHYRIEIASGLRVFSDMRALETRLHQHTVLSLFEGNSAWTSTSSTTKEFGLSQIVKAGYMETPYNWGRNDFGFSIRFFAHNWAISAGKMPKQLPSEVGLNDKEALEACVCDSEHYVWTDEVLTFNNGMVFWNGLCVGLATVPDGVYEARVSFNYYFNKRDVMWVVASPIIHNAIVPVGYWDDAYATVQAIEEEMTWYEEAESTIAPLIDMLFE